KLPRKFVDPATGLVRNNVRVVCTRSRQKTYLCRVALPGDPPGAGLLVRYRPGPHGKERYTWYGYRRAAGASRSTPKSWLVVYRLQLLHRNKGKPPPTLPCGLCSSSPKITSRAR